MSSLCISIMNFMHEELPKIFTNTSMENALLLTSLQLFLKQPATVQWLAEVQTSHHETPRISSAPGTIIR